MESDLLMIEKYKGVSVVLLGNFNPLMYHPTWFAKNGIISDEDANNIISDKDAKLILSPGLTIFQTSNLQFNISPDRFTVESKKEPLILVKDAVLKSFEKLLSLTIKAMGVNYSSHIELESNHQKQLFADRLTPKNHWTTLLEDEVDGDDRLSGLTKLTMKKVTDFGMINFNLEPSNRLSIGVYTVCNHHFKMPEDSEFAEDAMQLLEKNFDLAKEKTNSIILEIFEGF